MSSHSVVFTIASGKTGFVCLPASCEAPAGAFVGSGWIHNIVCANPSAQSLTVDVYDAMLANGRPAASTNRGAFELDVTTLGGVIGTTPNRVECYGDALANVTIPASSKLATYRFVTGQSSDPGEQEELTCEYGMVIVVTPSAALGADVALTVAYNPIISGSHRKTLAAENYYGASY